MKPQTTHIEVLSEKFRHNLSEYKHPKYNETQTRIEFINPFWEALGWDVLNTSGYAMAFRDVIHEDEVKVGGTTKAPDYSFRIGGKRIFFMETKKPSLDLKHDPAPAFQLRRYAYSARLPVSLLTDFEEFIVYDTRLKPAITDKPHVGRMLYFTFEEYVENWEKIHSIFSKEAVMRGDFDRFIQDTQGKKSRAEIDRDFLNDLDEWRVHLARNIALRNPGLSERELNFAVQMTIDRLIFLRMAEDRGIESQHTLQALLNGENVYPRLVEIYTRADERYNSGLFHFEEKDGPHPDIITPRLEMDDKVLKDVLSRLYYPACPYEFSVLPVEVLGNAYEQFLGKRISLTEGHRARIEEKPEVRKAGGVYYTPQYIVDYIVQNTVGKLLEGKTPKDAAGLRICDPACGSGSFLLGAYQYLMDWHLKQYVAEYESTGQMPSSPPARGQRPRKSDPQAIYQGPGSQWFLSTSEKKRILLNTLYGVDIDANAVEVTKLSLLLKTLENENSETLHSQMRLWHERALPNLSANIKCGNSLIGPDFYANQQAVLFDENEAMRINAFDWQAEYKEVFDQGGFDAVIGNPPYLYSAGKDFLDYFNEHYLLTEYQTDYYIYFIERAIKICHDKSYFSFIIPDSWLNSEKMSKIRNSFLSSHEIILLAVFDYPVFQGVTLENSIFVLHVLSQPSKFPFYQFLNPNEVIEINKLSPEDCININLIDYKYNPRLNKIIKKMEKDCIQLGNASKLNRGIHAYRTDGYGISKYSSGPQTKKDKDLQSYHSEKKLDETYLPELKGKHIFRYNKTESGKFLSYGNWLAEPRTPEYFYNPKIVIRKILGPKLSGTFIKEPCAIDQSLYIIISDIEEDLKAILGILLSRIGAWYFRTKFSIYDSLYPWFTKKQLESFPIPSHNRQLVILVDQILSLNEKLAEAREPRTREMLQRQIAATDTQIDQLVYALYNLTEKEIKIVEGENKTINPSPF